MSIADFLLARISEREAAARACAAVYPSPWDVVDRGHSAKVSADAPLFFSVSTLDKTQAPYAEWLSEPLEHIALNDPAYVLAECEAHRRIIDWHQNWPVLTEGPTTFETVGVGDPSSVALRASRQMAWLTEQEYRARFGSEPPTAPMLRFLALPYAEHPDFRDEWRIIGADAAPEPRLPDPGRGREL